MYFVCLNNMYITMLYRLIDFLGHLSHSGDLMLRVGVRRRLPYVNILS